MTKLVELKSVYAGYNDEVILNDVSLDIYDKDFIGIIGPNGGGKTTLLKVILGLIKPFRGSVKIFDSPVHKKNMIGYLPQMNKIDHKFPIKVFDIVLSGLIFGNKLWIRYSASDIARANQTLQQIGISDLKDYPVEELSGGQLQKVLLARAIVSSPRLLILDEPNTYVDNQFEGELYEILRQLNKEMAIIIVSHDLGTIAMYIKTIACVNRGLHYHRSNKITEAQLASYNCPIKLITHGEIPHTVLSKHNH
ncbi:MAG: ATP-binding cassette domain-containing protein [Bacteroidales bacterium]|jgi:zinc transport system ATP-binding protein|nr:ATP-binding cassette domain-containing protein [Bacteroidales bacterium]